MRNYYAGSHELTAWSSNALFLHANRRMTVLAMVGRSIPFEKMPEPVMSEAEILASLNKRKNDSVLIVPSNEDGFLEWLAEE